MRVCWCQLGLLLILQPAFGQQPSFADFPKKGSYLYFGQPAFEDNSFFIEEAITQEKGIHQFISSFYFDKFHKGDFQYSFTHQVPLSHLKHQLNYTLHYHVLQPTANTLGGGGLGDMAVTYEYMVSGKKDWAMIVPSIAVIIPTGKAINGHGAGGFGAQLSVAVTKRLSRKVVTHYNVGYTFVSSADRYTDLAGSGIPAYEKDLHYQNLGASIIWYQKRKLNWMLEATSLYFMNINDDGSLSRNNQLTINPGIRIAIDHNTTQIVPGLSFPSVFHDGNFAGTGIFFYLSFEPEYLPFTKAKSR
jgi:hypothetical protein